MATELRPQTIGALLDRAITLYARNAVALLAPVAVIWIPVLIAQIIAQRDAPPFDWHQLLTLPAPHAARTDAAGLTPALQQLQSGAGAVTLLQVLIFPIGNCALILIAAGLLDGSAVPLGSALRRSLRLWLPTVVVVLLIVAVALALFVVALLPVLVLVLLVVAAGTILHGTGPAGVAVGIAVAFIGFAAAIVAESVLIATAVMAEIVLVLEDANPFRAVGLALRRVFDRRLRRRTALVALAYTAVGFGSAMVVMAAGWVLGVLLHSLVVVSVVTTIGDAVLSPVLLVFMLLYTRDVRIRREGADLLAAVGAAP